MAKERHKEREKALHLLYEADIAADLASAARSALAEEPEEGGGKRYAAALVEGVVEKLAEIDRLIEASSENWAMDRMPVVDRNILRIAAYELLFRSDVPYKVAIDEAVELAKLYGSEESGAFVNGILDRIHRQAFARTK